MTSDEFKSDLNSLPGALVVDVVGSGTLVATVVSTSFVGQDEAARQAAVWSLLRNRHESRQLQNIEFIFTSAPGE